MLLAVVADLLLLGLQRLLTPWTRMSGAIEAAPAKTDAGPSAPATVEVG